VNSAKGDRPGGMMPDYDDMPSTTVPVELG
jgi:hypothetical protein